MVLIFHFIHAAVGTFCGESKVVRRNGAGFVGKREGGTDGEAKGNTISWKLLVELGEGLGNSFFYTLGKKFRKA